MAVQLLKHLATSLTRQVAQMSRINLSSCSSAGSAYRCLCTLAAAPRTPLLSSARISSVQLPSFGCSAQSRPSLLGPCQHLPCMQPSAGMKTKSALRRRCKDCFFVRRRGRLFVICKTHPRHKQRTNLSGQERTWQQVKPKYKNILQSAVKKKAQCSGTGGGPPTQDLTPAEELDIDLNKWRPVMEGIQGGTMTDSVLSADICSFLHVSGDRVVVLEPPEDDPGEGTSAAADEEMLSLDSRRLENLETAQPQKEAGNINTIRIIYAKHLQKQTELTETGS